MRPPASVRRLCLFFLSTHCPKLSLSLQRPAAATASARGVADMDATNVVIIATSRTREALVGERGRVLAASGGYVNKTPFSSRPAGLQAGPACPNEERLPR